MDRSPHKRAAVAPPAIRVASYNIHLGIGADGRFAPERIAAVIGELGASVIALQEVASGGGDFDMFSYLRDTTGLNAVAGPTLARRGGGEYGNALLTRHRVLEVRRVDLSVPRREPRGALDVALDCDGQPLRVVSTHLGLRPAERRVQIRRLLHLLKEKPDATTVLLGDLNEWFLWGRPMRWLHRHFEQTPAPATFPSRRPLIALDRIWVRPRTRLKRIEVHASPLARVASDHLPLTALLGPVAT
jgi:endonuclease/exonuclease/phosphatase family metal-dependent hydrolase